MTNTYKITIYEDQIHFEQGEKRYTLYDDGVFYSTDADGDTPQELYQLRDFIAEKIGNNQ